jgi:hypothetical protein
LLPSAAELAGKVEEGEVDGDVTVVDDDDDDDDVDDDEAVDAAVLLHETTLGCGSWNSTTVLPQQLRC